MYHNVHLSRVSREDVAQAAIQTVSCPFFGAAGESSPAFPKDCRFLPLLMQEAPLAVSAAGLSPMG
jgi:hypothetical protein